ncbi:MAG: hypothetical protein OEY44_03185 [Candidatus Peregrinibacteria bacterium]|nr:hypothetical protein [Candidatus Peregrinibacteria bacterium]
MSLSSRPSAPELPDLPVSELLGAYLRADLKQNNGAETYYEALRFFEAFADDARAQLTPLFAGFMSEGETPTPTPITVKMMGEHIATPAMPDLWTRGGKGAWMDADTPTPTPSYGYVVEEDGQPGEKVPVEFLMEDGVTGTLYGRAHPDDTPAFPLVMPYITVNFTPTPVIPLSEIAFRPVALDRGLILRGINLPPMAVNEPPREDVPAVAPREGISY